MARLRSRTRSRSVEGKILALLGAAVCLTGCSSTPTQRAELEYRQIVLDPAPVTASFDSSGPRSALTSVPTD